MNNAVLSQGLLSMIDVEKLATPLEVKIARLFLARPTREIASEQNGPISPAGVANQR